MMNEKERLKVVGDAVRDNLNASLADEVIESDAFGALAYKLDRAADGDPDRVFGVFAEVVSHMTEETLKWLEENVDNPAAYLASRVED